MGILSSGFRAKSFFVVVEFKEVVVVVPRTPAAASDAGSGGASPPATAFWLFLVERFLFVFRESFFSSGNLLSASAPTKGLAPAS